MKILIVDDDSSNLTLMRTVLEHEGYDVVQAVNGEKALEVLRSKPINLIISDILMPVMDGYHLCQECKSDKNLKNIPFIFCSGTYTEKKDENLSIKFGAEAFITKPFHNEQLLQTVSQVIENFSNGKINIPKSLNRNDKGIYKLYSERLIKKLEEKMLDLDKEKMALEMEIAERIKVEDRLRKSRNFAESLFNAAPGIVLILDMEGRIVRFNPYMELVSGYCSDDVKGKYWVDIFSPENGRIKSPNNFPSDDNQAIPMGNISSIITKTGGKKEIMWFDSTLKDDNGKIIGLLAVGQDVTRRMKKQKENFDAKTHEAIGNFSEDFARELDEIMAALFENISLLETNIDAEDQKINYLKEIKTAADRTKKLTSRLTKK
ncbi:MAG: response regulator, partial [Desulfobacteraceae bacterium]|nr:response regulator [Desulfobacteraceae bacterium]